MHRWNPNGTLSMHSIRQVGDIVRTQQALLTDCFQSCLATGGRRQQSRDQHATTGTVIAAQLVLSRMILLGADSGISAVHG
jgi:hypothetical protein